MVNIAKINEYCTKVCFDENGFLHCGDGPAIEENGPAIEWTDGRKDWYKNGLRHRLDGPVENEPPYEEQWYVNNKKIDINPILERLDISSDWRSWTDMEKMIVRLALP